MIRIDGAYLYVCGYSIHPLSGIQAGAKVSDSMLALYIGRYQLEGLLNQSVFPLKTSRAAGNKLLQILLDLTSDPNREEPINYQEAFQVTSGLTEFESILNAELGLMDFYLVKKKRGYDTSDLILNGEVLFPEDLALKVPEAVADVREGVKCIAFELVTAAGFHLHRANESVLHAYYDAVTNRAPRPAGRNIGDYLSEMNKKGVGDPKVKSCLKDLKDLHRNPLIHPEDSLGSVDDAIALLGSIQGAVVHMLKAIPDPMVQQAASLAAGSTQ